MSEFVACLDDLVEPNPFLVKMLCADMTAVFQEKMQKLKEGGSQFSQEDLDRWKVLWDQLKSLESAAESRGISCERPLSEQQFWQKRLRNF